MTPCPECKNSCILLMLMNKTFFEINKSLAENSLCELRYCYCTFHNSGLVCTVSLFRYSCSCWRCSSYQQNLNHLLEGCTTLFIWAASPITLLAGTPTLARGAGVSCAPSQLRWDHRLCIEKLTTAIRICSGSLTSSRQNDCHVHTLKLPDTKLINFPS